MVAEAHCSGCAAWGSWGSSVGHGAACVRSCLGELMTGQCLSQTHSQPEVPWAQVAGGRAVVLAVRAHTPGGVFLEGAWLEA